MHAQPFHYIYRDVQSCGVYAPAERADTLLLYLFYPYMYSVLDTVSLQVTLANPSTFGNKKNEDPKPHILYYWTMKHTHPIFFMWVCYGE